MSAGLSNRQREQVARESRRLSKRLDDLRQACGVPVMVNTIAFAIANLSDAERADVQRSVAMFSEAKEAAAMRQKTGATMQ